MSLEEKLNHIANRVVPNLERSEEYLGGIITQLTTALRRCREQRNVRVTELQGFYKDSSLAQKTSYRLNQEDDAELLAILDGETE